MKPPVSSRDSGLYVHFPYCEKKCPYCDFNSHAIDPEHVRYREAILQELEDRGSGFERFSTIYFGGGTPSLWDVGEVARIIERVRPRLAPNAEITLEANPGTVESRKLAGFVAAGVNRFSLGAQSFNDDELRWLGRIHDARAAIAAIEAAISTGARVSLDLIYGLPGQSLASLERTIRTALAIDPGHISAYTLTIEPDTHFGRLYASGQLEVMDDDGQADAIEFVTEALQTAGYTRYEVSSYAKPDREARHNSIYWSGGAYLGLGAGASSYEPLAHFHSRRRDNLKAPSGYLETSLDRSHRAARIEELDRIDTVADRLWTGVRVAWGLDLSGLDEEAGLSGRLLTFFQPVIARLEEDGWAVFERGRLRPTAEGFRFVDGIGRRLLTAFEDFRSELTKDGTADTSAIPLRGPSSQRRLVVLT